MKKLKAPALYFFIYCWVLVYFELVLCALVNKRVERDFLYFLCFVPAEALALTALGGIFKDKHDMGNVAISTVVLMLLGVYYIVQLMYYRIFGSFLSISLVGMGAEAMENFAWTLRHVLWENVGGMLLFLAPAVVIGLLSSMSIINQGRIAFLPRLAILALIVPFWLIGAEATRLDGESLQSAYVIYHDELSDTDTSAAHLGALTTSLLELSSPRIDEAIPEDIGDRAGTELLSPGGPGNTFIITEPDVEETFIPAPHVYDEIDLASTAESETDDRYRDLAEFLEARGPTMTNKYTGLFEGYNLIYVCAESFWTYSINEAATPTLYEMANHGIVLNNYYNSFKNTTTNGEFAFVTSLWPDLSRKANVGSSVGSFPQSAKRYMPMGLGTLFNNEGAKSYGYHNYYGSYYGRERSWPNIGYECKFAGQGMTFSSRWPASDIELMEQSVDDYINDERFNVLYMTFSGHGVYNSDNNIYRKNIDFVKSAMGKGYTDDAYGYLAGGVELDRAMEYLISRLKNAGKLDNTVIVIAGDHYPYNLSSAGAQSLAGHKIDTSFEMYKSTCIIYNAGMEENIVSDAYCGNVDILPTMLNLFNIEYDSRLLMGRDVFSNAVHKAVIYNKSFVTDMVRYDRRNGKAVWSEKVEGFSDEWKKQYIDSMNDLIDSEYLASLKLMSLDYYRYLWERSGLLPPSD